MVSDQELLKRYAKSRQEDAFTTLVERHLPLVYSVAVRQLQNSDLAKDVSQQVFLDLAGKASGLSEVQVLGGWLYQHTIFLSGTKRRSENRRKARECKMANSEEIVPENSNLMDAVIEEMQSLDPNDRDALVLRYLQSRSIKEVGQAMQCTEEAARKRIDRALERLRGVLSSKGIVSTGGAIGRALPSVLVGVPPGLSLVISAHALANVSSVSAITLTVFELMNTKLKVAIVSGLVGAGVIAPVLMQMKINRLEAAVERLAVTRSDANRAIEEPSSSEAQNVVGDSVAPFSLTWSEVYSDDHAQYMANLRNLGCLDETIKEIITARVKSEFEQKRKRIAAFSEPIDYWKTGVQLKLEAKTRLQTIDTVLAEQQKELLTSLLGPDVDFKPEPQKYGRVHLDNELLTHAVDPSKVEALKKMRFEIEGFFDANILPRTNIEGSPGFDDKDREDYAAFRKMEREMMAKLLTPEELLNVELHTRHLADFIRLNYSGFDFSPEEFRSIYQAWQPDEIPLDPYYWGGSDKLMANMAKLKQRIEERVHTLIGDVRFAEGSARRKEIMRKNFDAAFGAMITLP